MTEEWNTTILCVDDEQNILNAYKRILLGQARVDNTYSRRVINYNLMFARNGEEAVRCMRDATNKGERIAVGFFDMRMPGNMDGPEAMKRILEIDPYILCVVITGYQDREPCELGALFESQDQWIYISKPFSTFEIEQAACCLVSSWNRRQREKRNVRVINDLNLRLRQELILKTQQIIKHLETEDALRKNEDALKINAREAKSLLNFVNSPFLRCIDLPRNLTLFSHVVSLSCNEDGGDHYFIRQLPPNSVNRHGKTVISLKDQSGHFVRCILRSIGTDYIHQRLLREERDLALEQILSRLNEELSRSGIFGDEDFFTGVVGEIDHETLRFRFASAAHPPFFLIRGGEVTVLSQKGEGGHNSLMVLLKDEKITTGEIQLEPDDRLFFYTDGLTEASEEKTGQKISTEELREMLAGILTSKPDLPFSEIMNEIIAEVAASSGETIDPVSGENSSEDDVTVLGVEIREKKIFGDVNVSNTGHDFSG